MMSVKTIRLSSIHPNPFRAFDLNPLEPARINNLMDSMERNDVWGGIVARPNPEGPGYQLAFGHHRVEAMRQLGLKSYDFDVAELGDSQMIQYLADENLNQGGKNPRAIIEVVSNSIYHLERGLRECETAEAFVEYGNFTPAAGGSCNWPPNVWAKLKKNGTVGRDILKGVLIGVSKCRVCGQVSRAEDFRKGEEGEYHG